MTKDITKNIIKFYCILVTNLSEAAKDRYIDIGRKNVEGVSKDRNSSFF